MDTTPAQGKTRSELIDEIDRCKERMAQAAGSGPLVIISDDPELIAAFRASELGNT